jgi:excisionase family DNA binding protein
MTLPELAAYLKVSRSTVYKWVRRRELPGFRVGADWRFNAQVVAAWLMGKEKAAKVIARAARRRGARSWCA